MQSLIFLGATAVPEVAELVRDINAERDGHDPAFEMIGILDDNPDLAGTSIEGLAVLGPLESVSDYPDAHFVFCVGSHHTRILRYEILRRLGLPDERYATLVHPRAKVYRSASLGVGSILHCGSVVGNGTHVGRWVVVLWNSVIGAANTVGDGALIASNVTTNAGAKIGSFSFIGAASAVADGVEVGPGAMLGMGGLALRDIPVGAFQFGSPSKIIGQSEVPAELCQAWKRLSVRPAESSSASPAATLSGSSSGGPDG